MRVQSLRFPEWLSSDCERYQRLERFKFIMVNKVGSYLASLGLDDELKMLKDHVSEVEKNVKFFVEMKSLSTDISFLIQNCVLTSTTPLSVLNVWLGKAADLHKRLDEARSWPHLVQNDILDERKKLKEFEKACIKLIHHKRMQPYIKLKIQAMRTSDWKKICALLAVCDNNEHDIEDLKKY